MPKVTRRPARAAAAARSIACRNAARSPIAWSDGMTSISGSGSSGACRATRRSAATQAAGAVLRPNGSRISASGATPISRSCSAMMKRCSSFATMTAARRRRSASVGDPARGLLQQAALAGQRQKLLRVERARHRPQPRARTARQNNRMNHAIAPNRTRQGTGIIAAARGNQGSARWIGPLRTRFRGGDGSYRRR